MSNIQEDKNLQPCKYGYVVVRKLPDGKYIPRVTWHQSSCILKSKMHEWQQAENREEELGKLGFLSTYIYWGWHVFHKLEDAIEYTFDDKDCVIVEVQCAKPRKTGWLSFNEKPRKCSVFEMRRIEREITLHDIKQVNLVEEMVAV